MRNQRYVYQTVALVCLVSGGWAQPAGAYEAARPPFLEGKADFRDKELALAYGWGGPAAMDFAFLAPLSLGVSVDHVTQPRSWQYRGVLRLVDEETSGIGIGLTGAATSIRGLVSGAPDTPPSWGWQAGLLTTLLLEGGLTLRLGVQAYDTDLAVSGGQLVHLSPEIAYRVGLLEVIVMPTWPLNQLGLQWMGGRLRF